MRRAMRFVGIFVGTFYLMFAAFTFGICLGSERHLSQYITVQWGFTGCHVVAPVDGGNHREGK